MKKFKLLFFTMLTALVSLFSSCSSNDNEDQGPFQQCYAPKDMMEIIDQYDATGVKYVIVDFRSQDEYKAGHINGSVWLKEGTYTNMSDGSFAKAVHDYTGSYAIPVFLIGKGNNTLTTTLGGAVSKAGFGYACTYTLVCAYEKFATEYPSKCTK